MPRRHEGTKNNYKLSFSLSLSAFVAIVSQYLRGLYELKALLHYRYFNILNTIPEHVELFRSSV